ncbi:Uncharacterised protein [Vibrio cholerae]|nr:Uncharacterised protein [Vibrio cholerae]
MLSASVPQLKRFLSCLSLSRSTVFIIEFCSHNVRMPI